MKTKIKNKFKQSFFSWNLHILSYEWWKQTYELWKQQIQTAPYLSFPPVTFTLKISLLDFSPKNLATTSPLSHQSPAPRSEAPLASTRHCRVLAFCALADSVDIQYARVLFSQIERPNIYVGNTMIRGYCKAKIPTMGFSFFCQMARECVEMDCRSFVFALKASEQFCAVLEGVSVHCWVWKMGFESFDSDLVVRNGLVHFYAKRGCLDLRVKCLIKVLWEMW